MQYAQTMNELTKLKQYGIKKEKERLYELQQLKSVPSYTEKLKLKFLKRRQQTQKQKVNQKHQNQSLEPSQKKFQRIRLQSVALYNDQGTPQAEMEIQSANNQDDSSNQSLIFVQNQIADFLETPSNNIKDEEPEELKIDNNKINSAFRFSQQNTPYRSPKKHNSLISQKKLSAFKLNSHQVIYFLKSHSQFEDVKKEYLKWWIHKQQELRGKKLTEQEQNLSLLLAIPPEVIVQVPCDIEEKSHSYEDLTDDW